MQIESIVSWLSYFSSVDLFQLRHTPGRICPHIVATAAACAATMNAARAAATAAAAVSVGVAVAAPLIYRLLVLVLVLLVPALAVRCAQGSVRVVSGYCIGILERLRGHRLLGSGGN